MTVKNIIFVCTGNTCRSPMAAALFRNGLTDDKKMSVNVKSYGLSTFGGEPASEHAVEAMREYGIDIGAHRSTPLNRYALSDADLIVCMTEAHRAALLSVGVADDKIAVLNISDPYGGTLVDYRRCAEQIKLKLVPIYEKIR